VSRTDSATSAFFAAVRGLGKEAVDLSAKTRAALELDADPDTLDELEAAAASSDDHKATQSGSEPTPAVIGAPSPHDEEPAFAEGGEDAAVELAPPGRATHGSVFSARRTHPLHLRDVLSGKYGDDWLGWEPATLWWALRRDFGAVGELTRNKILALRVATKTYRPWSEWDTFEKCGLAWNDVLPVFGAWQPMPPSHVAFTVEALQGLHPEAPWTHEVAAYEAMILDDNGFAYAPPEWFPGAQAILDRNPNTAGFRDEVAHAWEKLAGRDLSKVTWRAESARDIHLGRLWVVANYLGARAALRHGDLTPARTLAAASAASPPVP
jgi:hypothetical protein